MKSKRINALKQLARLLPGGSRIATNLADPLSDNARYWPQSRSADPNVTPDVTRILKSMPA